MGSICTELYWDHAPKTCKNFAELARRGYYNGTIFHRIIADFVIQGGDPTGTGELCLITSLVVLLVNRMIKTSDRNRIAGRRFHNVPSGDGIV